MKRRRSLGLGFKDEVAKVSIKAGHFKKSGLETSWEESLIPNYDPSFDASGGNPWRVMIIFLLCLTGFFVLFTRLFHLQVVQGAENRNLADNNRIQVKVVHAPRGVIYDRNGKVLAANEPGFRLLESSRSGKKARLVSRDEALQMEVNNDPRFSDLEVDNVRSYPFGDKLAHVLGYMSEITEDELKDPQFAGLKEGDKIGRSGLEETYQNYLKGVDGGEIIEVNSMGQQLRILRKIDPLPGNNLYLSVDVDLQQQLYNQLADAVKKSGSCCGAAVAEDPTTGEILALVSYPSFDQTRLDLALTADHSPILNRAISGLYPPGSTFKIASALTGLNSGKITPNTIFQDNGVLNLGPYKFANWYFTEYGKTEGPVDLEKALKRSNDIYFYELGSLVGENILADGAKKLGLGKITGVDLPGEVNGVIPTPDWKERNINQIWYPGDTLNMAIGQGYVLATPIQIMKLTSYIASDGHPAMPHLAVRLTNSFGQPVKEFKPETSTAGFKEPDIRLIHQGLDQATENGGTAWPFFTFPIKTAGKTGTAEFGDPKNKTHAWYTGFAPSDNPKIVATAMVEAGGEGSNVAAPVVKELFRYFLSPDKNNLIKDTNDIATDSAKALGE